MKMDSDQQRGVRLELPAEPETLELIETDKEKLNQIDQEFWHNDPPQMIVLATASIRKAYFVYLAMNDFDFRTPPAFLGDDAAWTQTIGLNTSPLELQRILESHIRNGDGQLSQKSLLFLGFCHGVPIYVDPQNGETAENHNPTEQSFAKIKSLQTRGFYQNRDVLFIASDTVGDVHGQDLGKPRNLSDFPQKNEGESEAEYQEKLKAFDIWYVLRYYTEFGSKQSFTNWFASYNFSLEAAKQAVAAELNQISHADSIKDLHINSLLLVRGEKQASIVTNLEFTLSFPAQLRLVGQAAGANGLLAYLESGGGGITQRRAFEKLPLDNDILKNVVSDKVLLEFLLSIENFELRAFYLLLHLMGAPIWAYPMITNLSQVPAETIQ